MSNAGFGVRRRNSDRRLPALREFMDGSRSARRIRPTFRRKSNPHARGLRRYIVHRYRGLAVLRSPKQISLFLGMEMSRHFFHRELIQCPLTGASYFPLISARCYAASAFRQFPLSGFLLNIVSRRPRSRVSFISPRGRTSVLQRTAAPDGNSFLPRARVWIIYGWKWKFENTRK